MGAAAAGMAAGSLPAAAGTENPVAPPVQNPYGGGPSTGISLPPYFKPTPNVVNAANYFPRTEKLGPKEMRISFVGSCPFPPRREQAGTSMMVELGNGDRFFFDLGAGCLRNIVAMQVPFMAINDIFLSHLHVDHFADLPYLYCFAPWLMRWKPLRVHGPSGRTPKDGTKAMIEGMKQMTHWHTKSFRTAPVGDGYEVVGERLVLESLILVVVGRVDGFAPGQRRPKDPLPTPEPKLAQNLLGLGIDHAGVVLERQVAAFDID